MKVVILAGGLGTRISEETGIRPKPMVEIGGRPIMWHIMKTYSHYGFNEFIILTGYMSHYIKDYFINYYTRYSDVTVNMGNNSVEIHKTRQEDWKVTMLYTGEQTLTGSRIKKAQDYIGNERFLLTYGDGIADIDIHKCIKSHEASNKHVTLSAVQLEGRFGALVIQDDTSLVSSFREKPKGEEAWINGGFFVCEPNIFDYIPENDDNIILERGPLESLSQEGQLNAYKHNGFWHPMDTLNDKNYLTHLWQADNAPWKVWQ